MKKTIDVVVKVKRKQGKKDEPPKLHTGLPASMTFQQLLERNVIFFFENLKIWVGRMTLIREKNGDGLKFPRRKFTTQWKEAKC